MVQRSLCQNRLKWAVVPPPAENSIYSSMIVDGTIQTEDLHNLSVTTAKLDDNAVTTAKMEAEAQLPQNHDGADDITVNEIIRDVAEARIAREEEETLSAEELAKKQAENTVEVAAEMLAHQAAETQEREQELKEKEKTETCGVCLSDVTVGQEDTTTTLCGHLFHTSCLAGWLAMLLSPPRRM
eukprot:COSAG02_NODE_26704_length_626_cov_1.903226_1_plen_184_part_00